MNEVRIMKELEHKSIAEFYGQGTWVEKREGKPDILVPWMAMAMGGANLRKFIEDSGCPSVLELKAMAIEMCAAVQHLHSKGFIHRDIKPENFVRRQNGQGVLMIDFGIAKLIHEDVSGRPFDGWTRQDEFIGPANFSSPELLAYARDKTRRVDYRSDIFQLGKVIWYLATGEVSAGVPSKKKDPFGGALHGLILDALQDDPEERLSTVQEMIDGLNKLA